MVCSLFFFYKGVLSFEDLRTNASIVDIEFKHVSFWIHLHELPLAGFSKTSTIAIGVRSMVMSNATSKKISKECWFYRRQPMGKRLG